VFYQGGKIDLTANSGTALAVYRVFETPNQYADFGLGFRSWGFQANVGLNPGILPGATTNQRGAGVTHSLADVNHYDFGNGFQLTAYGDVGGFDLGAHTDWQVMGTIDYALNSWINLHLGYRSVNFDYNTNVGNIGFNVHLRGPIIAGTFRF
jgi:hypothetical protein